MNMKLKPTESTLYGKWIFEDGRIRGDENCERIEWLIENSLRQISVAGGGWEKLYLDPADGRYWELTYPQGDSHGGGAPKLQIVGKEEAKKKYNF